MQKTEVVRHFDIEKRRSEEGTLSQHLTSEMLGELLAGRLSRREARSVVAHLVQSCEVCIASFQIPRRVEFRDELPREDSGKIFKRKLRDPYWAQAGRSI